MAKKPMPFPPKNGPAPKGPMKPTPMPKKGSKRGC